MALPVYDENLIEHIPNLLNRVTSLEEWGLVDRVLFDAYNLTGAGVSRNTALHLSSTGTHLAFELADAELGKMCDAFAYEDIADGVLGKVIIDGMLVTSGLLPGKTYFLGVHGQIVPNPIDISGYIVQKLGKAYSDTLFEIYMEEVLRLR